MTHAEGCTRAGFNAAFTRRWWVLPLVAAAALLFFNLGKRGHLDAHEVLVAQTAREMIERGDWVLPHFSAQLRLQKPPLAYWLVALTYTVTGVQSELTARLPSATAMLLLVLTVAGFTARRFGAQAGITAGLFQSTMFWTILYGKSALIDSTLSLLVACAVLCTALDRFAEWGRHWSLIVVAFWVFCGLTVLAKGPVGLAIIMPTAVVYRQWRTRRTTDRSLLFDRGSIAGLCLFAVLVIAWPTTIVRQHPEAVTLWFGQSVGRFWEHWGPNTRPWYYYLYYTPLLTLPWSGLWLLEGIRTVVRPGSIKRDQRDVRLLLWSWVGVSLVFFSMSEGKRGHYILPALAPLAILSSLAVPSACALLEEFTTRWKRSILAVVGAITLAGAAALIWGGLPDIDPIRAPMVVIVLVAGSAVGLATYWSGRSRRGVAPTLVFAAILCALVIHEAEISPRLRWRSGAQALFQRNTGILNDARVVVQYGSNDRWAIFPLDQPMRWLRTPEQIRETLGHTPSVPILVPRLLMDEVQRHTGYVAVDDIGEERSYAEQRDAQDLVLMTPPALATRTSVTRSR